MDASVSRRSFLGGTAVGLGFAFTGAGSLEAFARPHPAVPASLTGYGPLVSDPNGLLALPEGFSYKVVAQSGTQVGQIPVYPSNTDGMGVFRRRRGSILISNHENRGSEPYRVPVVPGLTYDPGALGGTSTIVVDRDGNRLDAYTSLAGTSTNCAGGVTPWRTWLTCEEVEVRAGGALTKDHGYVFEVDPSSAEANLDKSPIPLKFMGRYSHEAVAVDPDRHVVYLTEDAVTPNGLYLRWRPPRGFAGEKGALHDLAVSPGGGTAGRLQAMSCYLGDQHIPDLSIATEVGTTYRVRWVDVPDRDGRTTSVRKQFANDQVTRSRKLEGQWWGNNGAYFVSSFARREVGTVNQHDGQVWFYDPDERTVTLKTRFGLNPQPDSLGTFDGPDNITVSPHGGLILAEDGLGVQHLIGVSARGEAYALARNEIAEPLDGGEFAGPCFSADGRILFVNLFTPGYTFAVTGPWRRRRWR
jgi:secreted PhoX family phosphatase